jgi:NTP pyrophosphatase (non-canonical NTP hydrolase)
MNHRDFERWVDESWKGPIQPGSRNWLIAVMGLAGETGEVTEPLKKHFRDGKVPGPELLLEFGDVLHYLIVLAHSYGYTLEQMMRANMVKLEARDVQKKLNDSAAMI